ncbi:hypothetical protein BSPWISOX_1652 [uncultured Gammaproteobacteria bacterium]|nr:hypothetical protein BSPWISOX_1652 [uncultured Gammaproteobacteria bacterium]
MPKIFLSHLCGGEPSYKPKVASISFLSHLCGGEHPSNLIATPL